MLEEQDFYHTALLEGRAAAQQQNSFYTLTTIPPARIAENANLLDIFLFEFKANKLLFLLSNAATNKQKAITAMYTEAEVEGKTIRLILNSGSTGSIITYQLIQQLKRNVDRPAQTVIVTANDMKKTPVGEIDNFLFTLDRITIPVKVLVIDAPQYQALVPATYSTFNKCSEKAPAFEFELEEKKPLIETFMALGSTSNWADETEQEHFTPHSEPETSGWNIFYSKPEPRKQRPYIPLKSYNSAFNKLYHYSHDAQMIFDLAMALINRAIKENVHQMKEAEYIEYTMKLTGFNYEDKVEIYHQIASHTYPTQKAQIQRLEQINIRLCEECIMPCDEHIPLHSKNDENKIEFGEPVATEEIETTPIYLIKNQPVLQLKYFNNNGQGIKPKKAHEIDAGYDLRYPGKDTLVLKPKSLTKINLKIALKIPLGAMVQIASRSSLASKEINIEHAEKIAQAIYLPLINISGLQLVNQREQLGKSDRGTQGFGSTG
ncbi:hypothetical protein G9A89_020530 [Geosiphon pyriformis]|nr:hypothetical protein G9A89_020530 [Geosiphon pyriformis]